MTSKMTLTNLKQPTVFARITAQVVQTKWYGSKC